MINWLKTKQNCYTFIPKMIYNRKKIIAIVSIIFYTTGMSGLSMGQISISIPDSTVCYNYEFSLPVQINTSVDDTITAYHIQFNYNPQLIEIYGASQKDCLTEEWGDPFYNPLSGEFRVVSFSTESIFLNAQDSLDTLLFIDVRVVKDVVRKTDINIQQAFFYDVKGQLEIDISSESGAELNIIHNEPPYISNIKDIKFFEDSTYTFDISSNIGDPDNTFDELDISLQGSDYFTCIYEEPYLTLVPAPHWSGIATLTLTVSDIYKYSDSDTCQVTVLPLEDDPLPFSLISPGDTIIQSGENEIEFFWEESVNVDKNDSITYTFYLGTDSTFQSGVLRKHTSLLRESILLIFTIEEGVYYWGVKAIDANGNAVWCNDKYRKLTVPYSAIDTPDTDTVQKFKIDQNYPNPFNSQTRINYYLPKSTNIEISVYDVKGRYIKTLLDEYKVSGSHSIVWDGLDNNNNHLSSGVYIINFKVNDIIKMRKVVFVK